MDKVIASIEEAVKDIDSGARILVGGFGIAGFPFNLINALIQREIKDLTIICTSSAGWFPFVESDRAKKIISGFTAHTLRADITNAIEAKVRSGVLAVENVPHGIFCERIRAYKAGFAGFYTRIGAGTPLADGKETKVFDGQEYVLERALEADFALIRGYQGDRFGNILCRYAARNVNVEMAGAAGITIAEVEEIVEAGKMNPDFVTIPGIFVQRLVQAPKIVVWKDGHESV